MLHKFNYELEMKNVGMKVASFLFYFQVVKGCSDK